MNSRAITTLKNNPCPQTWTLCRFLEVHVDDIPHDELIEMITKRCSVRDLNSP